MLKEVSKVFNAPGSDSQVDSTKTTKLSIDIKINTNLHISTYEMVILKDIIAINKVNSVSTRPVFNTFLVKP